jgi:hypothetical protein
MWAQTLFVLCCVVVHSGAQSGASCLARGQSGTCLGTVACAALHKHSVPGFCPGPEDIQCCVDNPPVFPSTSNLTMVEQFISNSREPIVDQPAAYIWLTLTVSIVCLVHSQMLHGSAITRTRLAVDIASFSILINCVVGLVMNHNAYSVPARVLWVNIIAVRYPFCVGDALSTNKRPSHP